MTMLAMQVKTNYKDMCMCMYVGVNWYIWFMRIQICIITWVLQHEGGLGGHCLCPSKPKGLKKNILNGGFFLSKIHKVSCEG